MHIHFNDMLADVAGVEKLCTVVWVCQGERWYMEVQDIPGQDM